MNEYIHAVDSRLDVDTQQQKDAVTLLLHALRIQDDVDDRAGAVKLQTVVSSRLTVVFIHLIRDLLNN
jgi:hypothetical protein